MISIVSSVSMQNKKFKEIRKFSFNGFEPTDFAGAMDAVDDQNAIADQGSSVAQKLQITPVSADANYDIHVTFIDQNNV